MKILHIVYQSLPNISGSSIRTRDIVGSQKEIGLKPVVVSSPFQDGESFSNPEYINEALHYRTYNENPEHLVTEAKSSLFKRISKAFSIFSFYTKVEAIIIKEKPQILHAHATFYCGIVAVFLGRKHKIPVAYELRSLWEEREKKEAKSIFYKLQPLLITSIETYVMKRANLVIAINKNLELNINQRGIQHTKIVANAVNTSLVKPSDVSAINKPISFGYIGSVSPIEGLDLMARVWCNLEKKGVKNHFHVYGTGTYYNNLKALIKELHLKQFHLHGSVKPSEISTAFNMIDVIVNPRIKSKITDTVTPLKPLEAMAYSKLVIASDVGGMKELIEHNKTGLLFKADDLTELEKCVSNVILKGVPTKIVSDAKDYVKKNKSWLQNAQKYKTYYEELIRT
jgi:glycogen(starch) synthase